MANRYLVEYAKNVKTFVLYVMMLEIVFNVIFLTFFQANNVYNNAKKMNMQIICKENAKNVTVHAKNV